MEGVIQNVYRCVQGERGITLHVHVCTYTISFHVFVLMCLVLLVEIQLYLHSKWMCLSGNGYFFPMRLISVVMKQAFFNFKLLFRSKVSQSGFNFNQIES